MMSDYDEKQEGQEAQRLLNDPTLKKAFNAVGEYVNAQAMTCDPADVARCQRIIITKQLLKSIERELYRFVENGELAQMRIEEIERKRNLVTKVFRR